MEMERTGIMKKNKYNRLPLEIYRLFSFYGERWLRPLMFFSVYLLAFILIEMFVTGVAFENKYIKYSLFSGEWNFSQGLEDVKDVFSYGVQAMTLQRTDTVGPASIPAVLANIFGPAMIALSLLALRRRFKR